MASSSEHMNNYGDIRCIRATHVYHHLAFLDNVGLRPVW